MKRNRLEWWKIALPVGIGTVVYFAYRSRARAAVTTHERVYTDPDTGETKPLRPTPGVALPEGSLAFDIVDFMSGLTDDQLDALRMALPPPWWDHIAVAIQEPTDDGVAAAFSPMVDDFSDMTGEEQSQMQTDVINAIGIINGYQLNELLKRAGVIPS